MRSYLSILFILLLGYSTTLFGKECKNQIPIDKNGVVVGGTFMVSLNKGEYKVTSYIPNGTIIKVKNYDLIKRYRKGVSPKQECYYEIITNLGKRGFILQDETKQLSKYSGQYIFPRIEVNIYKKPLLDKVQLYLDNQIKPKEIFLSSVSPKQKKQLKVLGITKDELFYEVTADFLGTKGYFPISDVQNGFATIVDTQNISFNKHQINYRGEGFFKIMQTLLPEKAYNELEIKAKDIISNIELSICKMPITLAFEAGVEFDTWWVDAGVSTDGKIEIKTAKRTYRYEEHQIGDNSLKDTIKISKSIICDDDGILYPAIIKFKFGQNKFEIRRESFNDIKQLLRTKSDISINDSFSKVLKVNGYLDWIKAYNHLDKKLQPYWAILNTHYPQILDLLIDSVSHYPSSERRNKGI